MKSGSENISGIVGMGKDAQITEKKWQQKARGITKCATG
jgi:cysteine sulfinate desulfinase/cysteine desulfurase-like protein